MPDIKIKPINEDVDEYAMGRDFVWLKTGRKVGGLLCQWTQGSEFHKKFWDTDEINVQDGNKIQIEFGKIVDRFMF